MKTSDEVVTRVSTKSRHPLLTLLILIVVGLCLYVVYDRVSVLNSAELVPAKVVGCGSEWVKVRTNSTSATSTYRDQVQYMPRAVTVAGDEALGVISLTSRSLCAQMVGKAVGIAVHPDDPTQNRIVSFVQFWAPAALLLFFPLAFALGYQSPSRARLFTLVFFIGFAVATLLELGVLERYFPKLITGEDISAQDAALRRCVWAAMAEEEVYERSDIKKLLCQDEGIDDLSSIADLVYLEALYLQGNALSSLTGLSPFRQLKTLSVAGNKTLTSTRGIENLPLLEEFQANKSGISDLFGIDQLSELKVVGLMMNNISDVSAFAGLTHLEGLVFSYNQITDISAFANKPALKRIQLYSNPLTDLTPLYGNQASTLIGVSSKQITCAQIDELRAQFAADVKVYGPKACN